MAEQDMPIQKQLNLLVEKFTTFETSLKTLDTKVDRLDTKVDRLDTKVGALDTKVGSLDEGVHKLRVVMEETRDLAKMGLEGLDAHRESTAAGFKEMSKEHAAQMDVLKRAVAHIGKRANRARTSR